MAVRFHELPLDVFPEEARRYIKRLNQELRELFAFEGTVRSPTTTRRSDNTVAQREGPQVHVSRVTPDISSVIAGNSSVVGTPALTLGTVNAVGTTNTVIAVDSSVAIFNDSVAPSGSSTASAVGTDAFAARRDHVHPGALIVIQGTEPDKNSETAPAIWVNSSALPWKAGVLLQSATGTSAYIQFAKGLPT